MTSKTHWEAVYETKAPDAVSWYAPHLTKSLQYISSAVTGNDAAIIDVGGGESTLVDDLMKAGYRDVTVLDLSAKAISVAKERLGEAAGSVKWMCGDILDTELSSDLYDVWHDRAVFHFLITDQLRTRYIAQMLKFLRPGGYAIVGTFGPEGPPKCSGLEVARYSASELHGTLGKSFELIDSTTEVHRTPWGATQQFVYCLCRRR
ncbi:MAG TPA: class I SAM-dependent methyltransferase [Steroidobacteraceae bacterium]|nr:class I SAM-dependent methyltransferase [Steroidobacteraceae bacterium]